MVADVGRSHRLSVLAAVLLAAATVFFVWGVFAERSGHHDESESHPSATSESAAHGETDEEHGREEGHSDVESAELEAEDEYRPFGIDLESTPLVLGAAAVSLALAALVVLRRRRAIVIAILAAAIGFTALEMVEAVHQADVSRPGLLVLALIAGLLHAGAALVAARLLALASRQVSPLSAG